MAAKKKKSVRKSKYADAAAALMKANDILMERFAILHAKAIEDGIVMCADERHRSFVRQFVFQEREILRTPDVGETLQ